MKTNNTLDEPAVKWSGSKRSQAAEIIKRFPREIETYYEPFCGGCSVLYKLLQTQSVKVKQYVVSDLNADLISLWGEIKNNHEILATGYTRLWTKFNYGFDGSFLDRVEFKKALLSHRKEFFNEVRDRFNKEHSPSDFLFLMRTCTNGMPRYNSDGVFNTSCHFSRPGIDPVKLAHVLSDWATLLTQKNVEFRNCSYEKLKPSKGDFLYADPPYWSVGRHAMYYGSIGQVQLFEWLGNLPCRWILSYDGKAGSEDFTVEVPKQIYEKHEYIYSGISGFRNLKQKQTFVQESIYMNFSPELETQTQLELDF